ncbi:acyl-CoA/acyl-ACP dehydrogenase [Bacillus sp. Bva_UNVM-123]|uniref:acyl-CoA dehydrogenase n=1 Tax=Bacillus sp. Bva_UNVM-123 TaxID=2829798 RepID=UPI00391EE7C5
MSRIENKNETLVGLIDEYLKPYVKKIESGDYYAERFLKKLGEVGLLSSSGKTDKEILKDGMKLVEEIALVCMTTAFCLWCHLGALIFLRKTDNRALRTKFLTPLEKGEILGGVGISNAMKYFAGLENLHLSAQPTENGYLISGTLPAVSNLGEDHWFGIIASVGENEKVALFVSAKANGLKLKEQVDYLGANGSATYSCIFNDVFVPNDNVLANNAASFAEQIRPAFVANQIPLSLGIIGASIASIEKMTSRQNGCNRFLKIQPHDLQESLSEIKKKLAEAVSMDELKWNEIAEHRLKTAYLALEAVQACMLHHGSAGYLRDCAPARRLREAYFYANLTPTMKHLEKMLQ